MWKKQLWVNFGRRTNGSDQITAKKLYIFCQRFYVNVRVSNNHTVT